MGPLQEKISQQGSWAESVSTAWGRESNPLAESDVKAEHVCDMTGPVTECYKKVPHGTGGGMDVFTTLNAKSSHTCYSLKAFPSSCP